MLDRGGEELLAEVGNVLESASFVGGRVVGEQVKADRVVGDHDRVEHARTHEPRHVFGGAMRRAEDGAEPAGCFLRDEELDHAAGAPDVLADTFEVVDAAEAVHRQPIAAEQPSRVLEVGFEQRQRPGALRQDMHVAARRGDGLGDPRLDFAVVGRAVYPVDAEGEAALERAAPRRGAAASAAARCRAR